MYKAGLSVGVLLFCPGRLSRERRHGLFSSQCKAHVSYLPCLCPRPSATSWGAVQKQKQSKLDSPEDGLFMELRTVAGLRFKPQSRGQATSMAVRGQRDLYTRRWTGRVCKSSRPCPTWSNVEHEREESTKAEQRETEELKQAKKRKGAVHHILSL